MRLILVDLPSPKRYHFDPVALSRPIWELRCGMTSLAEKLIAKLQPAEVACFTPPYMADAYRERTSWPVNDAAQLAGEDLLVVHGRVKAASLDVKPTGPSEALFDADGELLYARVAKEDLPKLGAASIDALVAALKTSVPAARQEVAAWNYSWELVLASPHQITEDFAAAGRRGILGTVEQPTAIRGSASDVYVGPGALVHPMVVIDAEHGPVYLDEGVEVHPFTRIEGPCYVGKKSILLGAKCREGNSIGPMCRLGGEVEESIIQGYSNKYHDGFLGHAYVGEWVNLGALTTNSDLKNDYARRPHADRHGLDQGGRADRRSHEDLDRHASEHRGVRRVHGPDRRHRKAPPQVPPLVRLVPRGRGDQGIRQEYVVPDGQNGHGAAQTRVDRRRTGNVGRNLQTHRPGTQ